MQHLHNRNMKGFQQQQTDSAKSKISYDLAIVGSGISCAYTLIHYISLLKQKLNDKSTIKTTKVAVLDKSGEFWKGIPYGSRSGTQSLIITPLKEFLPQSERDRFISWLQENYHAVTATLEQRGGKLNEQWLNSYRESIEQNNWDELFVPRYIFGWYLKEHVEHMLHEAKQRNYLQCDTICADVCNIQQDRGIYQIKSTEANILLTAKKVVLAIGSPPNKTSFLRQLEILEQSNSLQNNLYCVANMYEPSQNSNIERILNFLSKSSFAEPRQVLIIGSNASALETVYGLYNMPEAARLIDKFLIISPNGEFPHRIQDNPTSTDYVAHNLASLVERKHITAKQILAAVKQDVKAALEQSETIDGTYSIISKGVIDALNKLDFAEQKLFVTKYGVEIGKLQRRAGADYLNVVDKLILEGKLEFIQGKFVSTIPLTRQRWGFEFISTSDRKESFTSPIQVVINCAGFQNLTQSSSPLIKSLIQQEICIPNDSLCGFEMNEDFEAHQNFYLMGPLVAGNINGKLRVWHAESCGRIYHLSQSLAEVLVRS